MKRIWKAVVEWLNAPIREQDTCRNCRNALWWGEHGTCAKPNARGMLVTIRVDAPFSRNECSRWEAEW